MTSPTGGLVTREFPAAHPVTGGRLDHVALVTLNRPTALNALNRQLMTDLVDALTALDADPDCHCIVMRGAGERAFAAGADIKEMAVATPVSLAIADDFARWDQVSRIATPLIAAVRGYALGGGCELAMACDIIVAGDDAKFGQPEVGLGIIPGAGGTQRLTTGDRQGAGHGADPDRPDDRRRRSPTHRPGVERRACRGDVPGGARARLPGSRPSRHWPCGPPRPRSRGPKSCR